MRGIVINPYLRSITPVVLTGELSEIYRVMSSPEHPINTIEVGRIFPNGDNLLVDEEGLLKHGSMIFKLAGQTFIGTALLVGNDGENWVDHKSSFSSVSAYTTWEIVQ